MKELLLDLREIVLVSVCFIVVLLGLVYAGAAIVQNEKSVVVRDWMEGTVKQSIKVWLMEHTR